MANNWEAGSSIFDPVLAELTYHWFCPSGGVVLDPFAGGSVRGVVASRLGLRYVGIDLRDEQVTANRDQANHICRADIIPDWRVGDSLEIENIASDVEADLMFSCPPYGSLERYSDNVRDLSNMEHDKFLHSLRVIIKRSLSRLKQDRFAVFVVSDFRDSDGFLRRFPSRVVSMFESCGARFYNEGYLITSVGSLPIRIGRQFDASRKLGKSHQNWLCFVKGSPKAAAEACGDIGSKSAINDEIDVGLYGGALFGNGSWSPRRLGNISERFKVPPFSILDARDGWWQSRKNAWLALGIQSEVGRSGDLLALKGTALRQKQYREKGEHHVRQQ